MYQKISRNFSSLAMLVILALTLNSVGPVYAATGSERFHVQLTQNNVEGYDWTVGVSVTLTIDDPGTGTNPDFSDTQTADADGNAIFNDVGGIDLAAGMVITMTDGTTPKSHTVTPLSITGIDTASDTMTGTATPDAFVNVAASCGGSDATRYATADGSGDWSVDFSVVGSQPEEQTLCDLGPGSQGEALEPDDDGDHTDVDWRIPNPQISAHPHDDEVVGWDFLFGVTITLNIDDPGTGTNPDYTDTTTSGVHPENPDMSWFSFNFSGAYDLKPSDIVTVTDGTDTKNHVVTPVAVTSADAATDTVSGTAEIATYVYTEICVESGCYFRNELVDGSGDWAADFSTPGDEPGEDTTYDLQPGDSGAVIQWDGDGDETIINWRIRDPRIGARANHDNMEGWDWPVGPTLTIEVDDPGTGTNPDYSTTTTASVAPWDPSQTYFSLDLNGVYDLKAGDDVSVTDGSTTKVLTITGLQITDIDPDTDVVTGVAAADSEVGIWVCWDGGCTDNRVATADGSGDWSTDFSDGGGGQPTYDIQPNDWVDSGQWDSDGDSTFYGMTVPNPRIEARANHDSLEGWDWPVGPTLTIDIDDPGTGTNPDYTTTTTAIVAPWNPSQTYFSLDLNGVYDIKAGDQVSVTDGSTTKELTVTGLQITDIDPAADVVTGVAPPGSQVEIWACDGDNCSGNRVETADGSGDWSTDFSDGGGGQPIYDIVFGTWVDSGQWDAEGDATLFGVNVPSYTLHAVPSHPEVHGHDWPSGASVTMYVDDDGNPGNGGVLYTDTKLASSGDCGEPCFDLNGVFDLQVGHYVTFTDGSVTKVVQVSVLHVIDIDTDNETISGVADPGSDVMVNIHSQGGNTRLVVAAGDGSWTVDYSVPGVEDFESDTADLEPGDHGRAIQLNPDGSDDGTLEYWGVPPTPFTKSAPSNGALNQPTSLTLNWNPSSPEATYEYCYDTTDDNNCDTGWVDVGPDTSVVIGGLSYNTLYYWQVRANNEAGTTEADDETWWNFKTAPLIITMTVKSQARYDGWVLESGEFTNKGGTRNNLSTVLQVGDAYADKQYRAILSFGTAGIPDNAVITKVILKVKRAGVVGTNPMNTHNSLVVDIKKGKFSTRPTLQNQDFQAKANKLNVGKFSKKLFSGWHKSVLYTGAFPYINVKGRTQFRLRFLRDDNDDFSADILKLYSGNAGAAYRPQLIVQFYIP